MAPADVITLRLAPFLPCHGTRFVLRARPPGPHAPPRRPASLAESEDPRAAARPRRKTRHAF